MGLRIAILMMGLHIAISTFSSPRTVLSSKVLSTLPLIPLQKLLKVNLVVITWFSYCPTNNSQYLTRTIPFYNLEIALPYVGNF